MKKLVLLLLLPISSLCYSATFTNKVTEIRVFEDRVAIHIGKGCGTCGNREGWFGWSTTHNRHQDWMSLAILAKTTEQTLTVYDSQGSCNGPEGAVGIEGMFLKSNN